MKSHIKPAIDRMTTQALTNPEFFGEKNKPKLDAELDRVMKAVQALGDDNITTQSALQLQTIVDALRTYSTTKGK